MCVHACVFRSEQEAICKLLTDWQNAKPNRALITIGGDVHMGGFTDSWVSGTDMFFGFWPVWLDFALTSDFTMA